MVHLKLWLWFSCCVTGPLGRRGAWLGMAPLLRIHSLMEPPSTLQRETRSALSPLIPSTVWTTHQHSTSALGLIMHNNCWGMSGSRLGTMVLLVLTWAQSIPAVPGKKLFGLLASWTCFSTWPKETSIEAQTVPELPFPRCTKVKPTCEHPLQHRASPFEGRQIHAELLASACCCSSVEPDSHQLRHPEKDTGS